MTQTFPLFPLQLVVFPGEQFNLHVFEARYRQLIQDAEDGQTTWLVPTINTNGMRPTATEVTLSEVATRYPSGEFDVKTTGGRVFFLEDFWEKLPGKLYPGGQASELEVDFEENPDINAAIVDLTRDIYQRLNVDKDIRSHDDGFCTYDIGHYVGLTLDQEYKLLTLRSAYPRQMYLLNHLKQILPDVERNSSIKARAELNGHFKELTPPNW